MFRLRRVPERLEVSRRLEQRRLQIKKLRYYQERFVVITIVPRRDPSNYDELKLQPLEG